MKHPLTLPIMLASAGFCLLMPQAFAHPVTHGKKQIKKSPALVLDSNSKIDSNAYNFKSMASTSVNPQTGQFSTTIPLGKLSAHGLGQDFTLETLYQQGDTNNPFNIGQGWALDLPVYNPQTLELTTANGGNYKVSPAQTPTCVYSLPKGVSIPSTAACTLRTFAYHTMKDVILQTYQNSGSFAGAQIVYPDGHQEIINSEDQLTQLIYPKGFVVTFHYPAGTTKMVMPTSISDNFGDSITINNNVFTSQMAGQSHVVTLQGGPDAANLMQVSEADGKGNTYTTKFAYNAQSLGSNLLTQVTLPSGATTNITYDGDNNTISNGLPATVGSNTEYLPVVTEIKTISSTAGEQPSIIKYSYNSGSTTNQHNYTGYPNATSSNNDTSYDVSLSSYRYSTTEDISQGHNDGDTTVTRIIRTYDHQHLLLEKQVEQFNTGTDNSQPVSTQYYSYCPTAQLGPSNGKTFNFPGASCVVGQDYTSMSPTTLSGLPVSTETLAYDGSGNQYHTSQNLTTYDNDGNTTEQITCSDTDVKADTCLIGKTTSSVVDETTYAAPLVKGGITDTVLSNTTTTPFDGNTQVTNGLTTYTDSTTGLTYQEPTTVTSAFEPQGQNGFTPLTAQTNTWANGYQTGQTLSYAQNSPAGAALVGTQHLSSVATTTAHTTDSSAGTYTVTNSSASVPAVDSSKGNAPTTTQLKTTKTYDSASGQLLSETDAAGNVTNYSYDALGRTTQSVAFANSSNPQTTTYSYSLPQNGTENMTETLPKSASQSSTFEKRTVFDSLGYAIEQDDNMGPDGKPNAAGTWTELSSTQYGPTGKQLFTTTYTTQDGKQVANNTYFFYDSAGNKIATLYPNNTFNVDIDNAPDQLSMSYMATPGSNNQINGFKVTQKVPRTSTAFTKAAKNPSNIVVDTYLMPASPTGNKVDNSPVYSSTQQTQLKGLEGQIGPVLSTLQGETKNAQQGYSMNADALEQLDTQLAGFANGAISSSNVYSKSDVVYDGYTDEVSSMDTKGNTTTMQYNGLGQMIHKTNPAGQITNKYYNIIGKPVCISLTSTAGATDPCLAALKTQPSKTKS